LKPDTNYIFRVTNNSGSAISILMFGMLYELSNG
jgi:hypothetical protein